MREKVSEVVGLKQLALRCQVQTLGPPTFSLLSNDFNCNKPDRWLGRHLVVAAICSVEYELWDAEDRKGPSGSTDVTLKNYVCNAHFGK